MSLKLIFMGTPELAAKILSSLTDYEHEIVGVYTKPPAISGRGMRQLKSPVHLIAEKKGIPVFTPKTFKDPGAVNQFLSLNADVAVVAAYGLILRKVILEGTKYGCINVHPSDLPRWRGAAPIQRTIMAGDPRTSICIMKMDEGLDTGDVILRKEINLDESITAQELSDKIADICPSMLNETLSLLSSENAEFQKQSGEGITYADKITKEEENINWNQDSRIINCQIRALSPKPGARFVYKGEIIKIITAEYSDNNSSLPPGTVVDDELTISCGVGVLMPKLLQRQGRKMIYLDAFLRGFQIPKGVTL